MIIVVPTPLTSIQNNEGEPRIVISKTQIMRNRGITVESVKFTESELIGLGLKVNSVKCLTCGQTIRSLYHYHSVRCSCGLCRIDGGEFEQIRDCHGPYEELSKFY